MASESDSEDSCCGCIRDGVDASVKRGVSDPVDIPSFQKQMDAIEDRCGKPTDPNHNLDVTGNFRQPWDR